MCPISANRAWRLADLSRRQGELAEADIMRLTAALPGSQVWGLLLISAACRSKAGGLWPGSVPCR